MASCFVISCIDSKEVQKMKTDLLNSPFQRGKEGYWSTRYNYYLTDDVRLDCKEIIKLYKNNKFDEKREYYYNGKLMATVETDGTWDISSTNENSFYFDEEYSDKLNITNINFSDEWFQKFDTDIRITMLGEYDSDNSDEESSSGFGIIDCTPSVFIIQDLDDSSIYRYEPHTEYLN